MPNLSKMRDDIDAWLENKWPTIVARQENFRANRGRYWQGIKTHTSPPAYTNSQDGAKLGDRLSGHPTDQLEDWLNVFPEWASELLPVTVWIDVYSGPQGEGWCAGIEAVHNGTLWRRTRNVGPESHRTLAWHQVTP